MVKKIKTSSKTKEIVSIPTKEYTKVFLDIRNRIQEAQILAVSAANKELINVYWTIGNIIHERQESAGWGSKFIEKLSVDLNVEFPGVGGFSRSNLFRMRAFYLQYPNCRTAARQFTDLNDISILLQNKTH